ncbi:MAG: type I methionyl aminopeptidase [Ruminococcaceae bacterium]|nr:type I methionyl aminopeptidase [Oscillospiraceae bacterium]
MIVLKTARELETMKEACRISAGALRVSKDVLKAGVSTAYIDEKVREYILSQGATPSFLNYNGFPKSACISINEQVIHGIPNKKTIIQEGDIVSVDVGAAYGGYHGDNAATFGVGRVSDEAQRLMDVTRESLMEALKVAYAGNRIGDIGFAVQSYVEKNGFSVVREYVGHGVGRKLHEEPEVPNYGRPGHGARLVPGMTIAIEPMVNAGGYDVEVLDNDWTVVTEDGSLSAHFEYSIAITSGDPIILTKE